MSRHGNNVRSITIWGSIFVLILSYLQVSICIDRLNNQNTEIYAKRRLLFNLTGALVRDALLKLKLADDIHSEYYGTVEYELGIVASNVIDKMTNMIQLYKKYSDLEAFKKNKNFTVSEMVSAYGATRSYYNQLKIECDIYVEVEKKHEESAKGEEKVWAKVAEENNVPLEELLEARDKGLVTKEDLLDFSQSKSRRSMPEKTAVIPKIKLPAYNATTKRRTRKVNWSLQMNTSEAQFKKALRYKNWAANWRGFNPDIEGINVPKSIADIGLANKSEFLPKEIKGYI